jgi:hypothetical protein
MFAQHLFNLVSGLISSRWAHGREEHHGPYEEACVARLGPLRLEVNRCLDFDHDDASISVRIPIPWGKLHLGYMVCLGEEQIRRPGCYAHLQGLLSKVVYGRSNDSDEAVPF